MEEKRTLKHRRVDRNAIDTLQEFRSLMEEAISGSSSPIASPNPSNDDNNNNSNKPSDIAKEQRSTIGRMQELNSRPLNDPLLLKREALDEFGGSSLFAAFPSLSEKTRKILQDTERQNQQFHTNNLYSRNPVNASTSLAPIFSSSATTTTLGVAKLDDIDDRNNKNQDDHHHHNNNNNYYPEISVPRSTAQFSVQSTTSASSTSLHYTPSSITSIFSSHRYLKNNTSTSALLARNQALLQEQQQQIISPSIQMNSIIDERRPAPNHPSFGIATGTIPRLSSEYNHNHNHYTRSSSSRTDDQHPHSQQPHKQQERNLVSSAAGTPMIDHDDDEKESQASSRTTTCNTEKSARISHNKSSSRSNNTSNSSHNKQENDDESVLNIDARRKLLLPDILDHQIHPDEEKHENQSSVVREPSVSSVHQSARSTSSVASSSRKHSSGISICSSARIAAAEKPTTTSSRPTSAVDRLREMIDQAENENVERRKKRKLLRDIEESRTTTNDEKNEGDGDEQQQESEQNSSRPSSEHEPTHVDVDEEETKSKNDENDKSVEHEKSDLDNVEFINEEQKTTKSNSTTTTTTIDELENRDWAGEREQRRKSMHEEQEKELAEYLEQRKLTEAINNLSWDEKAGRSDVELQEKISRQELSQQLYDAMMIVQAVSGLEALESHERDQLHSKWLSFLFSSIALPFFQTVEKRNRNVIIEELQGWYNRKFKLMMYEEKVVNVSAEEEYSREEIFVDWEDELPRIHELFYENVIETLKRERWLMEVKEADERGTIENELTEFFMISTENQKWSKPLMEKRAAETQRAKREWREHLEATKSELVDMEMASRMTLTKDAFQELKTLHLEEFAEYEEIADREEQAAIQTAINQANEFESGGTESYAANNNNNSHHQNNTAGRMESASTGAALQQQQQQHHQSSGFDSSNSAIAENNEYYSKLHEYNRSQNDSRRNSSVKDMMMIQNSVRHQHRQQQQPQSRRGSVLNAVSASTPPPSRPNARNSFNSKNNSSNINNIPRRNSSTTSNSRTPKPR